MKDRLFRLYHTIADVIPLTWQGTLLFAGSGAIVYFFGVKAEDWVLLVVGLFGVLLTLLSVLSVGIAGLWLRFRLRHLNPEPHKQPLRTDTLHPALTDFHLPRFVLPFLDFLPTWESPKASVSDIVIVTERTEQVTFARRGAYDRIVRRFVLSDLFGLAEVRWKMEEERPVEVWPHTHPHQPPFARAFVEGNDRFVPTRPRRGDYVDTRAYIPGDPVRLIHWKLFARSNEPFVRVPEPSASFEHQILAYLITDPHDSLAARAARWDLEQNHLGDHWKFGADNCDQVATEIHTARRLLALSGSQPPAGGAHLESFLDLVDFKADQHRLLLYASGDLGRWMPQVLSVLKKHTGLVSMVIASEDALHNRDEVHDIMMFPPAIAPAPKEPSWKRFFLQPQPETAEATPRWWEQLQQLHKEGLQIQFIHLPQV